MYRKTLYALFLLILLIPGVVQASFKDVPETNKYYQAVKYLEDKGAIKGSKNSNFNPEANINKADLLKMVLLESGVDVEKKNTYTGFKDVKKNAWYAPYVKKALDLGIIEKGDSFNPTKTVRKWQGLEMIFEAKGIGVQKIINGETKLKFKDVKKGSQYAGIAKAAETLGIFEEDTFQANKILKRGDVAEILYKVGTKKVSDGVSEVPTITIQINSLPTTNGITTNEKFPILLNVWETIKSSYLEKDQIDENELLYGAISGMVEKLDDPYSVFQEPIEAEAFQTTLSDNYEGIGVMVEMIENKFTVVAPLPGTPAEKAGMKAGDIITHVNDEDISDMSTETIVSKIKGPAGTTVKLTIKRNGSVLTIDVERAKITLKAVSGSMNKNTKLGIITITSFSRGVAQSFLDTVNSLVAQGARGLVIDLRNNPGGFLDEVVSMLNNYVPKGSKILSTKYGDKSTEMVFSTGPENLADIKTTILVNKGTASASEIFAGILQDYGIAKVIGAQTFGKGTVQQLLNYGDGSSFKVTIAKWLTAKDRDIEKVGITPDIKITDDETTTLIDEVLEKGLQEILNDL